MTKDEQHFRKPNVNGCVFLKRNIRTFLLIMIFCFMSSSCAGQKQNSKSELPLIIVSGEFILTYDKSKWPLFYPTPQSEGEEYSFAGDCARNVYNADLNNDGTYEAYATISMGSGIVTYFLIGYDPVSGNKNILNERLAMDYFFVDYDGELFVRAFMSMSNNCTGIYRPILNDESLTFDLEMIGDDNKYIL